MSNDIVITGGIPSYLQKYRQETSVVNTISEGVAEALPSISIKGKVFATKEDGTITPMLDAQNNPLPSIDVVIVSANNRNSKKWYQEEWNEDSNAAPDCMSSNGVTPSAEIASPVASTCASCPKNEFGSAISKLSNKPIKACSDLRRVALIPAFTAINTKQTYLLELPVMSIKAAAAYGNELSKHGLGIEDVVTRISFQYDESYPRLKFAFVRTLLEPEHKSILEIIADPHTDVVTGVATPSSASASASASARSPSTEVQTQSDSPQKAQEPVAQEVKQVAAVVEEVAEEEEEGPPIEELDALYLSDINPQRADREGRKYSKEYHTASPKKIKDGTWMFGRGKPKEYPAEAPMYAPYALLGDTASQPSVTSTTAPAETKVEATTGSGSSFGGTASAFGGAEEASTTPDLNIGTEPASDEDEDELTALLESLQV